MSKTAVEPLTPPRNSTVPETSPFLNPGSLVVAMIAALEREGIPSVYLRNYEKLPAVVGNDVDLLLPPGQTDRAIRVIEQVAVANGWCFLTKARFGPQAVYFANLETAETLHLDLFERLEWHFLEIADAARVLAGRRFNGIVHIPAAADEVYLNLAARLAYQGKIREKHRTQATHHVQTHGSEDLANAFSAHLGSGGTALFQSLSRQNWEPRRPDRAALLRAALRQHAMRRPHRIVGGVTRYAARILKKLWHPPGHFIVLEGADGIGKSTVLDAILPWIPEWCAGRDTYDFHWKPVRLHSGVKKPAPSVDPRGTTPRSAPASFAFLMYHLAGFWWGWIRRIYPALTQCHSVVGDRYSYDIFLDPSRFRIQLPLGLCRIFALLAPRPDVTVGLTADPDAVHARKPELTPNEITAYQNRWQALASGRKGMLTVSADAPPEDVIRQVKQAILKAIASHGGK